MIDHANKFVQMLHITAAKQIKCLCILQNTISTTLQTEMLKLAMVSIFMPNHKNIFLLMYQWF